MIDLKKLQKETGLNSTELIKILRQKFPKMAKSPYSFAANSKATGVRLTPEAERFLKHELGLEKPKVARKKTKRITFSVDDAQLKRMKNTMDYLNCASTQEFLELAVSQLTFDKEIENGDKDGICTAGACVLHRDDDDDSGDRSSDAQ